jgi:hypothetical protein
MGPDTPSAPPPPDPPQEQGAYVPIPQANMKNKTNSQITGAVIIQNGVAVEVSLSDGNSTTGQILDPSMTLDQVVQLMAWHTPVEAYDNVESFNLILVLQCGSQIKEEQPVTYSSYEND